MDKLALLQSMLLIRRFEAALLRRPDHGFQLLSSGQEAVAVGLCAALAPADLLLSSGRSIGPALARGIAPAAVMAELLGKTTGPCLGKAGRGHLAQPVQGFFGAHAVVAGNLSIAAGVALAMQQQHSTRVVACLFGDGACGAGALHETMNIAALWRLPLVLVCDNNGYSVSTPVTEALAPKRLADLAQAFGIPASMIDGIDVSAVRSAASHAVEQARAGNGPMFIECISQRFATHSTSTRETRGAEAMTALLRLCPIDRYRASLEAEGVLSGAQWAACECEVDAQVEAALAAADAAPYPTVDAVLSDVI